VIGILNRREQPVGVEACRDDRRRWDDSVVVRVPEDELACRDTFAADSGD
jgi:hypothetical protein